MVNDHRGFSLPEALIALTISSGLVLMVGALFLVQNNFYAHVLVRGQVQENARVLSEVVATDVRSLVSNAVVVADSSRLVIRSPMTFAFVCGEDGSDVVVHIGGGVSSLVTSDVGGFGYRNPSGLYSYWDQTWAQLEGSSGNPATRCESRGADTVGASSEFVSLAPIDNLTGIGTVGLIGSTLVLFREIEFLFDNSLLVPGDRALFRGNYGSTLVELATGLADDAHFEYRRLGGSTWYKYVAPANFATIDAVRVVAQSIGKGTASAAAEYEFGWSVDLPLTNRF